MNKQPLHWKLICISEQLTLEQIIHARRFRNWQKYDKLSEVEKLLTQLEEFEIYEDIIDTNYQPKINNEEEGEDDEPDYFN